MFNSQKPYGGMSLLLLFETYIVAGKYGNNNFLSMLSFRLYLYTVRAFYLGSLGFFAFQNIVRQELK